MGIQTKAAAQVMLDKYYEAQLRIADGKSFQFSTENGTRVLTETDLPWVQKQITLLERRVTARDGHTHNVAVANFNHSN